MKDNKKKPVCIIPARGGSKRIKNKNIIDFFGKPIIAYSIITAKKTKLFSRIVVSTDSYKIKRVAEKYGAEVPFIREKKYANDYVGTDIVIKDCIKKIRSQDYEYHVCLYPCSPLIDVRDIIFSYKKIKNLKFDKLTSISQYNQSPERSFILKKNKIIFAKKSVLKTLRKRGQDLKKYYFDTGNIVIFKTSMLLRCKKFFFPKKIYFFYNSRT